MRSTVTETGMTISCYAAAEEAVGAGAEVMCFELTPVTIHSYSIFQKMRVSRDLVTSESTAMCSRCLRETGLDAI